MEMFHFLKLAKFVLSVRTREYNRLFCTKDKRRPEFQKKVCFCTEAVSWLLLARIPPELSPRLGFHPCPFYKPRVSNH